MEIFFVLFCFSFLFSLAGIDCKGRVDMEAGDMSGTEVHNIEFTKNQKN